MPNMVGTIRVNEFFLEAGSVDGTVQITISAPGQCKAKIPKIEKIVSRQATTM